MLHHHQLSCCEVITRHCITHSSAYTHHIIKWSLILNASDIHKYLWKHYFKYKAQELNPRPLHKRQTTSHDLIALICLLPTGRLSTKVSSRDVSPPKCFCKSFFLVLFGRQQQRWYRTGIRRRGSVGFASLDSESSTETTNYLCSTSTFKSCTRSCWRRF